MQELRLQLDGTHKHDCKKPGEILTTDQGNIMLLFCKRACGREYIIHMITYYSLNELLFYIEQIGFYFESVPAGIQKLQPSFQSHARRKENGGQQYTIANSLIKISVLLL